MNHYCFPIGAEDSLDVYGWISDQYEYLSSLSQDVEVCERFQSFPTYKFSFGSFVTNNLNDFKYLFERLEVVHNLVSDDAGNYYDYGWRVCVNLNTLNYERVNNLYLVKRPV